MFYKNVDVVKLKVDHRELSARLGAPTCDSFADDCRYAKLLTSVAPAYVAERVEIKKAERGLFIGDIYTDSEALLRVAQDSDECFIMVCTLGYGADKLINKESHISVSDAFFIDAVADALIEALCDFAEGELCEGLFTAPRFSPGYADLPLSVGKSIVSRLGAETRLGIKFSEGGMMIPGKSVSAIVCIKHHKEV